MSIDSVIIGAFFGFAGTFVTGWLKNRTDTDSNRSKENLSVLEHSGDFARQLSEELRDKGKLVQEIGEQKSQISELKRELEVANKNIEELIVEIKALKASKKVKEQ
ncbi:hypothetical protein [Leuconostoc citreum]|uniref:hypothetical protein n=1 Tax=Leuconostoc citreum TaxID=33964 RepID=UPI0005420B38|nr:hypothetical protein [Leuconostoc citreum]MDV8931139.1 hypothetical protein [Leuconostoc citreum]CDX66636.1 Protein of unknown function [Leuconostoc citreum]